VALSTKKSTGKRKLQKEAKKLKCCVENTYEVELDPSGSELDENDKEDLYLFRTMLEELKEIFKRSTSCIECFRNLTLTPSP